MMPPSFIIPHLVPLCCEQAVTSAGGSVGSSQSEELRPRQAASCCFLLLSGVCTAQSQPDKRVGVLPRAAASSRSLLAASGMTPPQTP